VLCRHDGATQIDRTNAVERLFAQLRERGVAATEADADIVMQDVDAAPALDRVRDRGREALFLRDVGLEWNTCLAGAGHLCRFRRGLHVAIDREHARAFLHEAHRCGAAIAHAFARALSGAHDDRDLPLEPHTNSSLDSNAFTAASEPRRLHPCP
jgi:hypothetical protein